MGFGRQVWTLTSKNFLIVLGRHSIATVIRAFILPIALMVFLSFAKNLFVPPAVFGIGTASPVKSLQDGLALSSGTGRDTVVFVNSGFTGGDIERVINSLVPIVQGAGKNATVIQDEGDVPLICPSSLRGVSPCYGACIFTSSPNEGTGGIWNYTIRQDSSLGVGKINVDKNTNDGEVYLLPFQRAIDAAITSLNNGSANQGPLPPTTDEYPFTPLTQTERQDKIRVLYQGAIQSFIGVAFIVGMIGICYHLTGFMASEREIGMSTLIDSMLPVKHGWQAQAARLLALHVSFSAIYLPGWIIGALVLRGGVFANTSVGVVLVLHILTGLALASMAIAGAALFRRSQLSGVTVTVAYLLLAILAQSLTWPSTGAVAALSLLFAPCNYVFFITYMAAFEAQQLPTDLVQAGPGRSWGLSGIVLWVFLIVQIIVYPVIGAWIERALYGSTSNARTISFGDQDDDSPVRLENFSKIYKPGLMRRLFSFIMGPKDPVVAVNGLTLSAGRGQILALLGANGSGKSTTLDSIAGTTKLTSGQIRIDGRGGLGIAPQKNVLWDEVRVDEHIKIFNRLKSTGNAATKQENLQLIKSIDLETKSKAQAKTLSGGQKRKLQLGMMLTGDSQVVLVDEVSSGLDPLSRRKIWDILLGERGKRTIIMTTHFLDEADLLADQIAILSKGNLRAEGSSVELKDRLGSGYRIKVPKTEDNLTRLPEIEGVTKQERFDAINYIAPSSSLAAQVIKRLDDAGIREYKFSGPSIEDVFLHVAEEVRDEGDIDVNLGGGNTLLHSENEKDIPQEKVTGVDEPATKDGLELLSGRRIGFIHQAGVLFWKRMIVFKSNWFPYVAAFLIPVVAAGLTTLFIKGQQPVGCSPTDQLSTDDTVNIFNSSDLTFFLVGGPPSKFNEGKLIDLFLPIYLGMGGSLSDFSGSGGSGSGSSIEGIFKNLTIVDTLDDFNNFVSQDRKNVTPAGFWLGDANSLPTIAYKVGDEMFDAWFGQWVLDMLLTNTTIASEFLPFDIPWSPNTGNSLQLLVYLGLCLCAYPGFFALYPNIERRRNVRGLEYSNGVRTLPLWLAYVGFDFAIVIISTAIVTIIFATLSNIWWHVGYIFLIFTLYGLVSILIAYVFSIWTQSQLSAYAFTASYQAVGFLVYLIAYLCTITYAPVNKVDSDLVMVHFIVSAFIPVGSIIRTLFLELNLFSATCVDHELSTTPGGILQYGGPILYLILQSLLLFGLLLWLDSGTAGSSFRRLFDRVSHAREQDPNISDEEVAHEMARVTSHATDDSQTTDGLRVVHLTKAFGRNTAIDNVTFGVKRGEVFALLGPNGAGKSTTISVIRGDLKPSGRNGGDVFVEGVSVVNDLHGARQYLGVCPQFDAIDLMSVREHLAFYARVRGISDVEHNVTAVLRAVGLTAFADMQAHALSGGSKRKLSLGIALMGNPTVVLLDEPSSGLDAAAKRIMWRTLAATVPGRSILLTTHSMEEADALAGRAGILSKRMLAMGTTEQLRRRFGDALHVHLVCKGAPHTSEEDMARVRNWIPHTFPGAQVEDKTYHGQMRFSIPASAVPRPAGVNGFAEITKREGDVEEITREGEPETSLSQSAIGSLVVMIEENKEALGIEHYSVSPTTLDQVFLTIVGRHGVQEEGSGQAPTSRWRRLLLGG